MAEKAADGEEFNIITTMPSPPLVWPLPPAAQPPQRSASPLFPGVCPAAFERVPPNGTKLSPAPPPPAPQSFAGLQEGPAGGALPPFPPFAAPPPPPPPPPPS